MLDLSAYPETHFLHDKPNKKVQLTMTDALQGKILTEIVSWIQIVYFTVRMWPKAKCKRCPQEREEDYTLGSLQIMAHWKSVSEKINDQIAFHQSSNCCQSSEQNS